jgi:hypothetical protein
LIDPSNTPCVDGYVTINAASSGVLIGLGSEVGDIDVAVGVRRHDHHAHPGHHRTRRIGAVGTDRDQADVTPSVAARAMICPDREQSGVFALRPGVRLQRYGAEAGDLAEIFFEPAEHFEIPGRLRARRERMDAGEFRPAHRHHLGGGVELHGA